MPALKSLVWSLSIQVHLGLLCWLKVSVLMVSLLFFSSGHLLAAINLVCLLVCGKEDRAGDLVGEETYCDVTVVPVQTAEGAPITDLTVLCAIHEGSRGIWDTDCVVSRLDLNKHGLLVVRLLYAKVSEASAANVAAASRTDELLILVVNPDCLDASVGTAEIGTIQGCCNTDVTDIWVGVLKGGSKEAEDAEDVGYHTEDLGHC